jgi:BirA family biotin operon repressor/biotin-[acetyl-CoA-carboxylase] ligase
MLTHGVDLGVKWVNDLFRTGRKAGGILTQVLRPAQAENSGVVIGVGLNLSPFEAPPHLREIVGYCADAPGALPAAPVLIGEIAAQLPLLLATQGPAENAALCDEYRRASVVLGRSVVFEENGRQTQAQAIDITPTGALRVQLADGREKILSSGHLRCV